MESTFISVSQSCVPPPVVALGLQTITNLDHQRIPEPEFGATTSACIAYLLAYQHCDYRGKREAFEHLVAIMLTATEGLFIPEDDRSDGDDTPKYQFVEEFLLEELHPWLRSTPAEIMAAAEADAFRFLGRRCRQLVLNKIRDTGRAKARVQRVSYNDSWSGHQAGPPPRSMEPEEFDAILAECDFLSDHAIETATALFDLRDLKPTQWATRLALRRGVSVQTARKHIRQFGSECQAAIRAGHFGAAELFASLDGNGGEA